MGCTAPIWLTSHSLPATGRIQLPPANVIPIRTAAAGAGGTRRGPPGTDDPRRAVYGTVQPFPGLRRRTPEAVGLTS